MKIPQKTPMSTLPAMRVHKNYESKNAELEITQEAVDTEMIEISNSDSEEEIQSLDLWWMWNNRWIRF